VRTLLCRVDNLIYFRRVRGVSQRNRASLDGHPRRLSPT
jgi:hypothetical protein